MQQPIELSIKVKGSCQCGMSVHMHVLIMHVYKWCFMVFYFCMYTFLTSIKATPPIQVINCGELLHMWSGGNTKSIDAIFKETQTTDAILMFDEAEALFGTRTETRSYT